MTQTIIELYNALVEAGVSKDKAEKASKAIISRDEAGQRLATKEDLLKLKSELIMWMVGLQIATIALIFTVLPKLI
jgi:hypothetical protein